LKERFWEIQMDNFPSPFFAFLRAVSPVIDDNRAQVHCATVKEFPQMTWCFVEMSLRTQFILYALRTALSKPCPEDGIPRSGAEGEAADCISVRFVREPDNPKIVIGVSVDTVRCLESDGRPYSKFEKPVTVPVASVAIKDFQIRHYYGLATIDFNGLVDFVRGQLFPFVYLQVHFEWSKDKLKQRAFNRNRLVSHDQIALLKILTERHFNKPNQPFGYIDLMTDLYSLRWVEHPDRERISAKLRMHLEVLNEAGALARNHEREYTVQAKALAILERHEEDERRHSQGLALQRRIVRLTWILVVSALIQAFGALMQGGLIKLNPWLDWSTPSHTQSIIP
jgi:hypothetical protein